MREELVIVFALTYLVAATALLAGAWLVVRFGWVRSVAAREWLWRAALVGGLIGAGAQTFARVRPFPGSTPLFAPPASVPAAARPAHQEFAVEHSPISREPTVAAPAPRALRDRAAELGQGLRSAAPGLSLLLAGLWIAGLGLRARLALGRRTPLIAGPWVTELSRLLEATPLRRTVRLSSSDRLVTPVAMGILRPEICVPSRALGDDQQHLARPALAHELAHVARFDPFWLGLAHAMRSLLFFQPLNRVAARELAHLAELSADDWAARQTGDGLALARCLTEVAEWLRPRKAEGASALAPSLGTCAMVRQHGRLAERIHRLLDTSSERRRGGPARLGATALVVGAPWMLPGWSVSPAAQPALPPAAFEQTWGGAAERAAELARELVDLEARLAQLAATRVDSAEPTAALKQRAQLLRAALEQLEPAISRGLRAEHEAFFGETR